MIDPTDRILTALYTLLNNTISVTTTTGSSAVSVPFYTFPPNDATYPFITVAQTTLTPDTDKTAYATEVLVTLDVVTAYEGDRASAKQANAIAQGILDLINYKTSLSLSGVKNWKIRVEGSDLLNEMSQSQRIIRKLMRIRFSVWEG